MNEADTCRKYVVPRLVAAGWDSDPSSFTEQKTFTDGRIVVAGNRVRRRPQKRSDYLLRYARDFPIAVVEAKADYKNPGDGLQQAKDYAECLDLKFARGQSVAGFGGGPWRRFRAPRTRVARWLPGVLNPCHRRKAARNSPPSPRHLLKSAVALPVRSALNLTSPTPSGKSGFTQGIADGS
jgi:hypothetical protein